VRGRALFRAIAPRGIWRGLVFAMAVELDRLRAEVEGMRPVVMAARRWCAADGESCDEAAAQCELIEAVGELGGVSS
jgi:hypothetical protein